MAVLRLASFAALGAALVLGLALVTGWPERRRAEPPDPLGPDRIAAGPASDSAPRTAPAPTADSEPGELEAADAGARRPVAANPGRDWRHSGDPEEALEPLERLPTRIDYPLLSKYVATPMSEIPHDLVAAWDELPDSEELGERRVLVVVVDPTISDADLEALARDVRARHRDADFLRLRVFDSRTAAGRPSWTDGGASRRAHLVADLRRSARSGREQLDVRGRSVAP